MTTVINTNIASQIAQNYLQANQQAVTNAITQLSSGLAINSAADNPAGLAIATTLQAQINGQTVAQQNANNGISLAQTGESALTQITNNLQTIRQLAVQASNASNSPANRASLNQEVQQSLAQINTIAATTTFNGQALLDGAFGAQNFQIGANAGQTIAVNLSQGAQTSQIGQTSSTTFSLQGTNGVLTTEALNISVGGSAAVTIGNAVAGSTQAQATNSAYAAAAAVNASNISGLTATANNTQNFTFTTVTNSSTTTAQNYNLTINGTNIFGTTGDQLNVGQSITSSTLVNAINAQSTTTGVTASLGSNGTTITLNAADGSNILATQSSSAANAAANTLAGGLDNTSAANGSGSLGALVSAGNFQSTSNVLQGKVTLSSASSIQLSGAAATDIASQSVNSTNGADSLLSTQTITSTSAFNAGTSGGTIGFYVGATANAINIGATSTDTATTIANKINTNGLLQQAGITASVNAQGNLVVNNTSGQSLAVTDTPANAGNGFKSGIDNAQVVASSSAFNHGTNGGTLSFTLNGQNVTFTATSGDSIATFVNNINGAQKVAGITAVNNGGDLELINTSGYSITAPADAQTGTGTAFATGIVAANATPVGTFETPTVATTYTAAQSGALASVDVLTVADAQHTIQSVDSALSQISTLQGQLGAVQNRFTSIISNLTASVQNATSTQSSIEDTNYASATSALSRAQVLSQAAQAMVAQANALPQQVLKLLQ
ncbi:flagellin N-terminal helical domain-containing protein [Trinickia mobilis]|uniref:flagellin N-terminal helical domain-containing protein n=1 Tax=Trinickia mobilis TaxID=2816356 RepID=UPI001A8C81D2|nr:flagellin [Trinickia mobilis]